MYMHLVNFLTRDRNVLQLKHFMYGKQRVAASRGEYLKHRSDFNIDPVELILILIPTKTSKFYALESYYFNRKGDNKSIKQ